MTKHRPPLSFQQALNRVAGQLPGGIDEIGVICDRRKTRVYEWSNPDTDDCIPIGFALKLDTSYQDAGGVGAPFYEAYTSQLELLEVDRFALPTLLGRLLVDVIKECGDASVSLAKISQPGANDADLRASVTEFDQAIAVLQQARIAMLGGIHHQTDPPS